MPIHLLARFTAAHALAFLLALIAWAGAAPALANNIETRLLAEGPAAPGSTVTVAIAQNPVPGWHGYWLNPGDAGFGMTLDWSLPPGFVAGEPQYPVPQPMLIGPLMNHVYEGPYAILVPIEVPADATPGTTVPVALKADWLACTDEICVPEKGQFATRLTITDSVTQEAKNEQFFRWRAALPAPVLARGTYEVSGKRLRIAVPVAQAASIDSPHLFLGEDGIADYAAPQRFSRSGDWLIVETDAADGAASAGPASAVLRLDGEGRGLAVTLEPGEVPDAGSLLAGADGSNWADSLFWLTFAAFLGGLILNVMPCVFPILSLKALSLARANSEGAHVEALAYTGGVMLAVLSLGAAMLGLRAAGQEIGWAFQLQEPATVVLLLVLAAAITANLSGLYEMTLPISMDRQGGGAFLTGLLAAFVATPCTGPFMAAAMGAALLLPVFEAMLLFAALGFGLAFPFLLIGFVPHLRRALPAPGRWMVHFRRAMAVPMGLTAIALVWLTWRVGGAGLMALGVAAVALSLAALAFAGRRQRRGRGIAAPVAAAIGIVLAAGAASTALAPRERTVTDTHASNDFSDAALAEARASGKPVFAYFTADWCVTCKINEATAIDRDPTRMAFEAAQVVVLRGDWTLRDPAITRYLEAQGAAGVPLYAWYEPGKEAEILPQILTSDMLVERAKASGASIRR